jgi:hypothetical protein
MKTFVVRKEHLKLAKRMVVYWNTNCYLGAPAVDSKRPYGDSSILENIGEIIGEKPEDKDGDYPIYSERQLLRFGNLHKDMEHVVQILLANLGLKQGVYEADDYDTNWRPKSVKREAQ